MSAALEVIAANGVRVAVIWLLLVLLAVIALAGLALPRDVRRPRQITAWLGQSARHKREVAAGKAAEAQESIRYAEEIAVAAHGADVTAERRRDRCQQAQAQVGAAWQEYQDAHAALGRALRAAAFAAPRAQFSPDERKKSLRRSAEAAYHRGELSDTQLLDALTHRDGWDPALHPLEHEVTFARAAVRHRFAAYQAALVAEQEAWRAADIATAAVHSLRREAMVATALADAARSALPGGERAVFPRRRVTATA
jgi:hypothetical protein